MAMTSAEKMRAYRQRIKEGGKKKITQLALHNDVIEIIDWYRLITFESRSEALNQIVLAFYDQNHERLEKEETTEEYEQRVEETMKRFDDYYGEVGEQQRRKLYEQQLKKEKQ